MNEIAGCIVWRQQGEHAAGPRHKPFNCPVIGITSPIKVDGDEHWLPGPHAAQAALPQIRLNPEVVQGNDCHDLVTWPDAVPDLRLALGYTAGNGCSDLLAGEFNIGVDELVS